MSILLCINPIRVAIDHLKKRHAAATVPEGQAWEKNKYPQDTENQAQKTATAHYVKYLEV
jgi:hypothetical protein